MMKSDSEKSSEQLIRDPKYLERKSKADILIIDFKNEIRQEIKEPHKAFFGDADMLLHHHNSVYDIYAESFQIAQKKLSYFSGKQQIIAPIITEYQQISLDNKDDVFLKTFRSRIGEHIRKYAADANRLEDFAKEFTRTFRKLAEKGARLSYLQNQHARIQDMESRFAELSRRMDMQVQSLQAMRVQAFRLMKNPKE
ncbi:MAG: hypothetical protein NTX91_02260 [candidate division SR1 bacterium]|nr:hypothetical protein [candidate division SR1 bacterium]